MTYRILVTGSRDWTDGQCIRDALRWVVHQHGRDDYLLVHGACPTGADHIADMLWLGKRETHPADWRQYGRRAGFVRNADMAKLGANICLAFIKNNSKGTLMMAGLAEANGIETVRYYDND